METDIGKWIIEHFQSSSEFKLEQELKRIMEIVFQSSSEFKFPSAPLLKEYRLPLSILFWV